MLQPFGEILVSDRRLAQLDEGAHHVDAHLHSLARRQHIGRLDGAVFSEGVGRCSGKLQLGEVVTVCDHLDFFRFGKLKPEVGWKAVGVALDSLVQCLGRHAIQFRQIGVDDDLDAAHQLDARFDAVHGDRVHVWSPPCLQAAERRGEAAMVRQRTRLPLLSSGAWNTTTPQG